MHPKVMPICPLKSLLGLALEPVHRLGVVVDALGRLVVVPVAKPDLEAVALRKAPQRPVEHMVLFEARSCLHEVLCLADVALFPSLHNGFRHKRSLSPQAFDTFQRRKKFYMV